MKDKIKKIIFYISYYLIIGVLLLSGIAKLIDPLPTIETLNAVKFFDESINIFIATALPLTEIGLAILLITKQYFKITAVFTTILFLGFLLFAIYGYAIGLNEDCGCFGSYISSLFGIIMIIRNILFLILSSLLMLSFCKSRFKTIFIANALINFTLLSKV